MRRVCHATDLNCICVSCASIASSAANTRAPQINLIIIYGNFNHAIRARFLQKSHASKLLLPKAYPPSLGLSAARKARENGLAAPNENASASTTRGLWSSHSPTHTEHEREGEAGRAKAEPFAPPSAHACHTSHPVRRSRDCTAARPLPTVKTAMFVHIMQSPGGGMGRGGPVCRCPAFRRRCSRWRSSS